MKRARNLIAGLLIAAVGIGAMASGASAAAPMKVKVAPYAGTKVRVAKRLKVVASCTSDCAARVRITLYTPVGKSTVSGSRNLEANIGWITGMILTPYGVNILRNHYRYSRLKVVVTARNLEHGTIRTVTRFFRFRLG